MVNVKAGFVNINFVMVTMSKTFLKQKLKKGLSSVFIINYTYF